MAIWLINTGSRGEGGMGCAIWRAWRWWRGYKSAGGAESVGQFWKVNLRASFWVWKFEFEDVLWRKLENWLLGSSDVSVVAVAASARRWPPWTVNFDDEDPEEQTTCGSASEGWMRFDARRPTLIAALVVGAVQIYKFDYNCCFN